MSGLGHLGPDEGLREGDSRGADEVGVVQSGERLSKLGLRWGAQSGSEARRLFRGRHGRTRGAEATGVRAGVGEGWGPGAWPLPPHPPGLGSPVPDGSLAAPAPCSAAAPSRAAVPAPPSGSISAAPTGERPGSWEPGAQWPDRFAHLVPAPSQQAYPVPVWCAQLSRTGGCRCPPPLPPRPAVPQ